MQRLSVTISPGSQNIKCSISFQHSTLTAFLLTLMLVFLLPCLLELVMELNYLQIAKQSVRLHKKNYTSYLLFRAEIVFPRHHSEHIHFCVSD